MYDNYCGGNVGSSISKIDCLPATPSTKSKTPPITVQQRNNETNGQYLLFNK